MNFDGYTNVVNKTCQFFTSLPLPTLFKPKKNFQSSSLEAVVVKIIQYLFPLAVPLMDSISNRYPLIETAEIRTFVNGPESFTPDYHPHISRSLEVKSALR